MKKKMCYILGPLVFVIALYILQSNPPLPAKLQELDRELIIDDVKNCKNGYAVDVKDPHCYYHSMMKRHLFLNYQWSSYWIFSIDGKLISVQFRSYNNIAGIFDRSGCIKVNDIESWQQSVHKSSTNTTPISVIQP